jgi:hypothetical protein
MYITPKKKKRKKKKLLRDQFIRIYIRNVCKQQNKLDVSKFQRGRVL